jgi:type IV pilus assembly protein PilA
MVDTPAPAPQAPAPRKKWSWGACLWTFGWLRARGMNGAAAAYFFVSTPVLLILLFAATADRCAEESMGVARDVLRIALAAGFLVPGLFAHTLHQRHLARKGGEPRREVLSWILMPGLVVLLFLAIPSHVGYDVRARVGEVIAAATPYRDAVTQFATAHGRLPTRIEELGAVVAPKRCVSAVTLAPDASVSAVASFEPLKGQSIRFTPRLARDAKGTPEVTWSCTGGDIPPKYRPAACR